MADPFIGEIRPVPYTFAPRNWAFCSGQLLPINQNQALFSLIGTTYGGNGQTNFALPDLRGRVPMSSGTGPGLSSKTLGEKAGVETVTLTANEIPAHNHPANVSVQPADQYSPGLLLPAVSPRQLFAPGPTGAFAPGMITNTGGNQAHNNLQPYLTISFVIALTGIFPPLN
ncbi:MAG: phage tail protein [Fimbriimonadaceae bacterium]|nr:phage tail protein [Fimbriimonadaceae bacterium]